MIGLSTFEFDGPEGPHGGEEDEGFMTRAFMNRRRKGKSRNLAEEPDGAVYFLELNSDAWTFSKPMINSKNVRPQARAEHSASKIATNEVAIFGGWTERPVNDLWVFDYVNLEWREAVTSGIQPRPRYRHTSEVLLGRMIVLGGSDNGDDVCDGTRHLAIHELNLENMTWSHPELKGGNPFPRSGHSSGVIGAHSIVVFGGKRSDDVSDCYYTHCVPWPHKSHNVLYRTDECSCEF
jgi:hypothetical protein